MNGKVFIKNLKVSAKVGHEISERHVFQDIIVNVKISLSFNDCINSENLADTIDYKKIQDSIIKIGNEIEFVLIESFANSIIDLCFKSERIQKVWISLEKLHKFKESESVGIEMERIK